VPRPVEEGRAYVPGLDGIRAIAVILVIAYHVGLPQAKGGMLGVGVFFTLSGYLITDLLLGHWSRHGSFGLKRFWLHRARRLLPAVFVLLVAVSIWVALFDAAQLVSVRRQVVS
jgi:peptidoglycan/LPS O-acetylase OafA/YrhL